MDAALEGFRVLELADSKGHYCGKLLADLGADVIKIEKPGGDDTREIGPFKADIPHPEGSLSFAYYNTNKRGITLNLETPQGKELFQRLVKTADAVIETFPVGTLSRLGLDYPVLRSINPGIVLASITGFGQTGPHRDYLATDIVAFAMSGAMHHSGDIAYPPCLAPGTQACNMASASAALGILLALHYRRATGQGQHIDVSLQEAFARIEGNVVSYSLDFRIPQRGGQRQQGDPAFGLYACKNGYVHLAAYTERQWDYLVEWMGKPEELADPLWRDKLFRRENREVVEEKIADFMAKYTREELFEQGRRIPVGAVNTPGDLVNNPQIVGREYFVEGEHSYLGKQKYPGAPYRLSETPCRLSRTAPLIGEHDREIYCQELGYSEAELVQLKESGVTKTASQKGSKMEGMPLEGVRVVAFSTTYAGPTASTLLGDYGAEVIKVESRNRVDDSRFLGPYPGGERGLEKSGAHAYRSRNKRGITLNMATPKGRELAKRLIQISDVVLENFSARVMQNWGLDYPHLKEIKPDIILIDLQGLGMTGPLKDYITYGPTLTCLSGMTHLWRTHDTPEPIVTQPYPDCTTAILAPIAVVAALHYRARTGKGQHIDLSQVEGAASMLGPIYMDYLVNGREQKPIGNRHIAMAPHGCYRCRGEDKWCAIAVGSEEEWGRFCQALGDPSWAQDPKFADMTRRLENVDELDRHVESWTKNYTPHQVMRILQSAGVAAGAVQDNEEVYQDYHLRERGFLTQVEQPQIGCLTQPNMAIHLSESPGSVRRHAPLLGQDNDYVFGELLGLRPAEISELQAEGAIS